MKRLLVAAVLAVVIFTAAAAAAGERSYVLVETNGGEVLYDSKTGKRVTDPRVLTDFKKKLRRSKIYDPVYDPAEEERFKEELRSKKEEAAGKGAASVAEKALEAAGMPDAKTAGEEGEPGEPGAEAKEPVPGEEVVPEVEATEKLQEELENTWDNMRESLGGGM